MKELCKSVTNELGPVDLLINNAGVLHGELIKDCSDESVRKILDVNLKSHFWVSGIVIYFRIF